MFGQVFSGVALRIDADEQRLRARGIVAQFVERKADRLVCAVHAPAHHFRARRANGIDLDA